MTSPGINSSLSVSVYEGLPGHATLILLIYKLMDILQLIYGNIACIFKETMESGKTSMYEPFCPLLFELKSMLLKIPLSSFVLTNSGEIVDTQMEMRRSHIRTIGISLLGGKSGIEGPYELGIENIRAVNTEDATKAHGTFVDFRKNWTS